MIKSIIFDLGGVILTSGVVRYTDIAVHALKITEENAKRIWPYMDQRWFGKISVDEFFQTLKNEFQSPLTVSEIKQRWSEYYDSVPEKTNDEILKLIDKLKKNYAVYLLTVTSGLHDHSHARQTIYQKFKKVFKSHKLKIRKTNTELYKLVLKEINTKPEECIYIDDRLDNVKTAQSVGILAFQFVDNNKLYKDLRTMGILV